MTKSNESNVPNRFLGTGKRGEVSETRQSPTPRVDVKTLPIASQEHVEDVREEVADGVYPLDGNLDKIADDVIDDAMDR